MLSDKSQNLTRDISAMRFDYIIFGNTFWGAALLYALAKSGKRVAFITQNDFYREDNYTFTSIFPYRFSGISKSGRDLKNLNLLRKKIPHLVLQQRSLFLCKTGKAGLLSLCFNLISAKDKTLRSVVLDLSRYCSYKHFHDSGYKRGVLSREFRINESRLLIETLKEAESEGAFIVNSADIEETGYGQFYIRDRRANGEYYVKSKKVILVRSETNIKKFMSDIKIPAFDNPVRVISRNYDFMLSAHTSGRAILQARPLKGNKFENSAEVIKEFEEVAPFYCGVFDRHETSGKKDFVPSSAGIVTDRGATEEPCVVKSLAKQINLDLSFSSLPGKFSCQPYGLKNISDVIELANSLYDEAKQAGIGQERFMEMFYRYGAGIETITETAYAQRGEGANQEQAWRYAVENYQKLYEWKIE